MQRVQKVMSPVFFIGFHGLGRQCRVISVVENHLSTNLKTSMDLLFLIVPSPAIVTLITAQVEGFWNSKIAIDRSGQIDVPFHIPEYFLPAGGFLSQAPQSPGASGKATPICML